jgi:DNA polymerase-3 subunit delta
LVEEAAQQLYDAASALDTIGMNCDVLDGEQVTADAIVSLARSYPMMADRRVIWVRRFDRVAVRKDRQGNDPMSAYLRDPSGSTFLLLTASIEAADGISASLQRNKAAATKKIAGLKHPFGTILSSHAWMEFPAMRDAQARSWVRDRAKGHGWTIDEPSLDLLLLRTGASLRDLALELDKLEVYVGDRRAITADDVLEVVASGRSFNVYELQRAIAKRDTATAFMIVTNMMELGRQEMLIIAMLTRYYMALFRLADARTVTTDRQEMARLAEIPPFALGDHLDALDQLGPARVERGLHALTTADGTLKSSSTDALTVLHTMLARMLD